MEKVKSKIFWKLYFWLIVILTCIVLGVLVVTEESVLLEENIFTNIYIIMYSGISLLSLSGLYGFIYEKKFFYKELWIFILAIIIIEELSELVSLFYDYQFLMFLIIYIFLLPFYYGLYKYAFKIKIYFLVY